MEDTDYKPLNVWAGLGYNTDDIIANISPEDTRIHPKYGWALYPIECFSTKKRHDDDV